MGGDNIDYRVDAGVAQVTLNRPEVRNAQSRRLLEQLDQVFAEAAEDRDVVVIALFGAGEHFSAGHDLGSAEEIEDRQRRPLQSGLRGRFEHSREHFVDKTMRWRNLPKPTIAGVHGYCIYAGWMIASAMDIIYAADNTMFLGANFQYFSIPWDIHPRKAKELLYESRFVDAQEALELGMVNQVVAADELNSQVLDYARRVAANDPFQLRMIKQAVNQVQDTQGFAGHISSAHALHILSSEGEKDPDYALSVPEGARRPMVQRAFDNYQRRQRGGPRPPSRRNDEQS